MQPVDLAALTALLAQEEGKAEIVNGTIVRLPLSGFMSGFAAGAIYSSLRGYGKETRLGYPTSATVTYIVDLPHRQAFCPDVAFTTDKGLGMGFPEGAPIFAGEVREEDDYGQTTEIAIAAKRADYFAVGTLVVWDVDLQSEDVIHAYRADTPDQPLLFRRGEMAHAEPALPGWHFAVDSLFPDQRRADSAV